MALITGTPNNDVRAGTEGGDTFLASDGSDIIDGGNGSDLVDYSHYRVASGNGGINVNLDKLTNTVAKPGLIASIDYIFDGLTNIESVTGSVGNDSLRGNEKANILRGERGNDLLVAVGGNSNLC